MLPHLIALTLFASPFLAAPPRPEASAVFAGGCFWGVEAVFEHVRGVRSVVSGFAFGADSGAGGPLRRGHAGHAEAVRVVYDPAQVSYQQLLQIFFTVAHDPTQLDRQGPDVGPEYRSTIFFEDDAQRLQAHAALGRLDSARTYPRPVVTEIVRLGRFRVAEDEHQDYMVRHPSAPYVVINDRPKIERLRREFPGLFRERP